MGFGKRVCEILAVLGAAVLIGALVWYFSGSMRDRGYDKEGTLVWKGQETPAMECEALNHKDDIRPGQSGEDGEAAYPAFVTDPASRIYRDQESPQPGNGTQRPQSGKGDGLSRSGRGL